MRINEKSNLEVINPISAIPGTQTEAVTSVIKPSEVRAIYPLIRSINSGRLTKNFTYYPAESLIGKNKPGEATGYSSFVLPYGKPIIREHRQSDWMGEADVPLGRVVYAGFRRYREKIDPPRTTPNKPWIPGTVEGDGALYLVPAITGEEAIEKVLGGIYYTVSIGCNVEKVIESISGEDLAKLFREEKELPPYVKGQIYDGKLSYWKMGEIRGVECSFVNVPSDEYAAVEKTDIGFEGIQLLVGEKKIGKESYSFYDAKTGQKVLEDIDESVCDTSFFKDSMKIAKFWWLEGRKSETLPESTSIKESVNTQEETMTLNEKIVNNIKDLDKLIEINQEGEAEFNSALLAEISNQSTDTPEVLQALVEGAENLQVSDLDAFKAVQEKATTLVGTWNESAAKLVLLAFDGTVELTESAQPDPIDEPVEESTPEPETPQTLRGIEHGVEEKDGTFTFYPVILKISEQEYLTPVSISAKEEIDFWSANWDVAKNKFKLVSEAQTQFETFLSEALTLLNNKEGNLTVKPINLPISFLVESYKKNESNIREYLLPLVAITRKLKVDPETLKEASNAYNVFSNIVLQHFLANPPAQESVKNEEDPTPTPSSKVVEMNTEPVSTEIVEKKADLKKPWYNAYKSPRCKKD